MKKKSIKRSALALILALSLTTFVFPLTASADVEQQEYTYKTYQGKTSGKVKVTDAYKKDYTATLEMGDKTKVKIRIPKVTIPGVNTNAINSKIYKKCKSKSGGNKYEQTSCTYSYYVGKEFISLYIGFDTYDGYSEGGSSYLLYNISRKTGKKMTKAQVLKVFKISKSKFKAIVKKDVIKSMNNDTEFDYSDYLYNKNISDENLKQAIPYLNSKGKRSYLLPHYLIPAGSGDYTHGGTF